MPDRDAIIKKVQDCWRLADNAGATEHERSAAAEMASKLMAKYQIDEIVLQEKQGKREQIVLKSIRITKDGKKAKFEEQRKALAVVVARENRCRCVIQYKDTTADVATGKRRAGGVFLTVMGYESDTQFVEEFYWMVAMQLLESALDEQVQTENYQMNFASGYVDRIDQRLREIHRRVDAMAADAGASTALALVDRGKAVEDAFARTFPNLRKAKASKKYNYDSAAHARGAAAANNADLGQTRVGEGGRGEIGTKKGELRP